MRKLAAGAAADGWGVAKLRAEIKKAQEPDTRDAEPPKAATSPLVLAKDRAMIDLAKARATTGLARDTLASELTALLVDIGLGVVVVKA